MFRLLTIGGSDPSGGAGIQADIKVASAFSCYASSVVTAVTAQSADKFYMQEAVSPELIRKQIIAISEGVGVDAIKIGMLHNAEVVEVVASAVGNLFAGAPVILDPVMVSSTDEELYDSEALDVLVEKLFPLCTLITPNLDEYKKFSSQLDEIDVSVLVKGGHKEGSVITDVLNHQNEEYTFRSVRTTQNDFHGTGCALATATACELARGKDMVTAIYEAINYVQLSIRKSPRNVGNGNYLNHMSRK